MGNFKLPEKSIINGTTSHSSALKKLKPLIKGGELLWDGFKWVKKSITGGGKSSKSLSLTTTKNTKDLQKSTQNFKWRDQLGGSNQSKNFKFDKFIDVTDASKTSNLWQKTKKFAPWAGTGLAVWLGSDQYDKGQQDARNQLKNLSTDYKFDDKSDGKAKDSFSQKKSDPYARAKRNNPELDNLIAARKHFNKNSKEYAAIQNQINVAYGDPTRHGVTGGTTTGTKGVFGGKSVETTTKNVPGISDSQTQTITSKSGKKKVTKKRYEDDKGITTKKHKSKYRSSGIEKKRKSVYKTDWDKDGKVDKKTKVKVKKDIHGDVKRKKIVRIEDGIRTVTKTDKHGNVKKKSRKTLNPFD